MPELLGSEMIFRVVIHPCLHPNNIGHAIDTFLKTQKGVFHRLCRNMLKLDGNPGSWF
jgi:hypothetical protein